MASCLSCTGGSVVYAGCLVRVYFRVRLCGSLARPVCELYWLSFLLHFWVQNLSFLCSYVCFLLPFTMTVGFCQCILLLNACVFCRYTITPVVCNTLYQCTFKQMIVRYAFSCTWVLIIYHTTVCLSMYNQPGTHHW